MERRLSAILAADVVGYSAHMERDEAGTFERLKARRQEIFEPEVEKHHGRIFKLMGDGVLAEFASVVDSVECAVSVQRSMAELNASVSEDERIDIRIGINLGEVIIEGEDRYGEGVNIAARLQQLAEPGGICVSGKVSKEVEKKLAFAFEPMGEQRVKNIIEPIAVFRVKLDGAPAKRKAGLPYRGARTFLPWAGLLAVLAAVVVIGWVNNQFSLGPIRSASASIPSVAVLPFDNMSDDPKLGYFGDGVSEDIISMLARSPDLSVVARNSSFAYKGKPTDVRQVGKELNVGYVLEGSVRKDADKVRIVAQLIDAKSGEHVWAERFDKTSNDPWALQDEVTGKIIAALTGETGQLKRAQYREAWGKDSANLQEYEYYLRGHDQFMQFTKQSHEQAGLIWTEGLSKFPNSALLQVKLGFSYFMRGYNGWSNTPKADFERAEELLKQTFAHQSLSPLERRLGHWLASYIYSQKRDFNRALKAVEAAATLAPYDAFMIGDLAQILIMAGQPAKAIEWAEAAASKDPANLPIYNLYRGWALAILGEYEKSLAALRNASQNWVSTPLLRSIDLVRLNKLEEAKIELKKALDMDPTFTQAKWRDMFFYSDPSIVEREIADLRKVGLPE
jgi:TolB-like protein/class 3 adenylate cyclase